MLEQLGNTLTFYAFYVESKVGKTGLTVTVDVWEVTKAGVATEVATGASATEVGDGLYRYILADSAVDAEGEYLAVFKTATDTVDQQHIPAMWAVQRAGIENLDASIAGVPTTAEFEARTLPAADYFDPATDTVTPAAGSVTAAVIATDAIDADAIAANAVTEIQSGLSTFNSVSDGVIVTTNNDKTGYALSGAGVDAILDEAITEPAGVFAWGTATLRNIVGWLGALNRNKITQTADTQTLRNDADNASLATSTVSDDATTATRGEWS